MIVVGDIHGKKEIVRIIVDKFQKEQIIWLGDWFDGFGKNAIDCIDGLILALNRNKTDIFLFGNHDIHYLINQTFLRGSGFNEVLSLSYKEILESNLDRFKMLHFENNILYSHAGVTNNFLKGMGNFLRTELKFDNLSVEKINESFEDHQTWIMQNPLFFIGPDRYGHNQYGGPLWCDWSTLIQNPENSDIKQIVGHSRWVYDRYTKKDLVNVNNELYCIDCLDSRKSVIQVINNEISEIKL